MTVYLIPNMTKSAALATTRRAAEVLLAEGATVLLDEEYRLLLLDEKITYLPAEHGFERCDVAVTIGGDGTMLHAARKTREFKKPLLGVNIGRLGFLTVVESDEIEKLRCLPKGDFTVVQRSMLQAGCQGNTPILALNDIVLFKASVEKTIGLYIYCDEILVSQFRGDGVVIATPTGSTAYSMSAGGPILDARLGGIVVTQICAHIVYTPPMVFAGDRTLRVVPEYPNEEQVMFSCDGLQNRALRPGEELCITQASQTVPLVQLRDTEQLESIDKKLKGR